MANLANFSKLLSDYAAQGQGLPRVTLSQASDLGQAADHLVTIDNRREGEADAQLVARYVKEICDALADERNQAVRELFESTIASFSAKVGVALKSIGEVKEQAASLAKDMEDLLTKMLAANEYVSKHQGESAPSEDFPVFNWDGVKSLGSVIDLVKDVTALVSGGTVLDAAPTVPDQKVFNVLLNKIDQYLSLTDPGKVESEERDALIEAACQANQGTAGETIADVVDMLLCIKRFPVVFNIIKFAASNKMSDIFKNVRSLDNFIDDVYPVAQAIADGTIALPEAARDGIVLNAQTLVRFCKIAGYYVQMMRTTIFSKSLLLQDGNLNADLVEQFKEAGGDNKMIAYYVRHIYQDQRGVIPAIGVTGEAIIKAYSNIAPQVEKNIKDVQDRVTAITTTLRAAAYDSAVRSYVTQQYENSPEVKDKAYAVQRFMDEYGSCIRASIVQFNIPFIDAAMASIIKCEYRGTFVEHLQENLGVAYIKTLNSKVASDDAVSSEDITVAEATVISGLVADFVCDNFLEPSLIVERQVPTALRQPQNDENTDKPETTPGAAVPSTPEEVKKVPDVKPAQES